MGVERVATAIGITEVSLIYTYLVLRKTNIAHPG